MGYSNLCKSLPRRCHGRRLVGKCKLLIFAEKCLIFFRSFSSNSAKFSVIIEIQWATITSLDGLIEASWWENQNIVFCRKVHNLQMVVSQNMFYCQNIYSNGIGSQVLTTLVLTLPLHSRYRGSYMSAHVLLNLLNELGKRDKMRGLPSILSFFCNEFNKFNNTRARMLDSIYHMT